MKIKIFRFRRFPGIEIEVAKGDIWRLEFRGPNFKHVTWGVDLRDATTKMRLKRKLQDPTFRKVYDKFSLLLFALLLTTNSACSTVDFRTPLDPSFQQKMDAQSAAKFSENEAWKKAKIEATDYTFRQQLNSVSTKKVIEIRGSDGLLLGTLEAD